MSAKSISSGIEILDLGCRRLYVKTSTGFVIHNDDLTPEELLVIATDIASQDKVRQAAALAEKNSLAPGPRSVNSRPIKS